MPYTPEDAAQIKSDIIRLAKQGLSKKDTLLTLGISQGIYYDWQKKDPEFKKALDKAKVYTSPTGQSLPRRSLQLLSRSLKKVNGY